MQASAYGAIWHDDRLSGRDKLPPSNGASIQNHRSYTVMTSPGCR
jgi:hypothetical protein